MADLGAVAVSYTRYTPVRVVWPPSATVGVRSVLVSPMRAPPARTTKVATKLWRAIFTPPWWGQRPIGTLPLPNSRIEGHVYQRDEDDVDLPVNRCRVRLYYRPNGALVANGVTDAAGHFRFLNLMPGTADYYVIAFDPDGAPVQNALIYDRLTPQAD